MICRECAYEADMRTAKAEGRRRTINLYSRKQDEYGKIRGHAACTGCDCHHGIEVRKSVVRP